MIYAKTGMERMPENCWKCDMEIASTCLPAGKHSARCIRPDWCPLIETDETLSSRLAEATDTKGD